MNRHITQRAGWIKYGLLLALMLVGGAGGLYLCGVWTAEAPQPVDDTVVKDPAGPSSPCSHRFPLSQRDAKDGIEAPELAVDSADRVFLAWASKTAEAERTVFFTRSTDAGRTFDVPRALSKGGVFRSRGRDTWGGHERRATPHLAVTGKDLHLTWSEAAADGANIRLLLATSTDAGATFGLPRPVHHAGDANPTFTALGCGIGGELACAWLGGPAGQQPFAAMRQAGESVFTKEMLVHPGQNGKGVCPCCPLSVCFGPDKSVYVAFRNIADGHRDIAIGVLKRGQEKFDGLFSVIPPAWKFNGCPHDGPSLAIVADTLHVVWMDARSGSSRCYHAQTKLADMKFTAAELHPIQAGTQGNARLYADAAGRLHAVWEESTTAPPAGGAGKHQHEPPTVKPGIGGKAIQYAILGPDGKFGPPRALAPRDGAFQTRPAIAVTHTGRVFVAWNELDESGKAVVVTAVSDDDLPGRCCR